MMSMKSSRKKLTEITLRNRVSLLLMIDGFSSFSHSIAVDLFIASENTSQSILVTLFLLSSK